MNLIKCKWSDKTVGGRALRSSLLLALLAGGGLMLYGASHRFSVGIPCALYSITGLYCPGCGATRALVALADCDVSRAVQYNLMLVVSLPFIIAAILRGVYNYIKFGTPCSGTKIDQVVWVGATILIVLFVLFAILRNLAPFEALAPS